MKNLLVITLLFLVGCSQNFKYVLDCELSEVTQTNVVKTEGKATIKFNDTKVGSRLYYNLIELRIISSPYYPNRPSLDTDIYAERIFANGAQRHLIKIYPAGLFMESSYYLLNKDDKWKPTSYHTSNCKLR